MEGTIVRRVIPSDNSCLFNAVGYVMDHDKKKAPELRQVIAATVAGDPTQYSEAFLGKPNEEYCDWILNPEKWGGAIELAILADYYGREIAAYDIQTTRCDLYGQGKGYHERVMLIYDGLHYDALAMSPSDGAPEEFDQTIFSVQKDGTVGPVERLTLNLIMEQQRKRSYTDTANFTLRCGVCQIGKGVIPTLPTSLCDAGYARLESLAKRKLWSMRKQQDMSTFKNIDDRNRGNYRTNKK